FVIDVNRWALQFEDLIDAIDGHVHAGTEPAGVSKDDLHRRRILTSDPSRCHLREMPKSPLFKPVFRLLTAPRPLDTIRDSRFLELSEDCVMAEPLKMVYEKDAPIDALKGKTVAILGFGSQGHAHGLNLRESGIKVIVANRKDSAN